jgi:hypothetical protein
VIHVALFRFDRDEERTADKRRMAGLAQRRRHLDS